MINTPDWNPDLYLQFKNERTQPAIDLANRININRNPQNILDIGCGPGNSAQPLLHRWPSATVTGIDNSPAMIEKAKNDYPKQQWILADARTYQPQTKFDIIFSNAAIQWIPDHEKLFEKLRGALHDNGALAIQIPLFHNISLGKLLQETASKDRWKTAMQNVSDQFTIHDFRHYYDLLSASMKTLDIWETKYIHIMPSPQSIIEWTKSTGMKPYLDRLESETDKIEFERELLQEITKHYPAQKNGNTLFPFKRLFFIGYN